MVLLCAWDSCKRNAMSEDRSAISPRRAPTNFPSTLQGCIIVPSHETMSVHVACNSDDKGKKKKYVAVQQIFLFGAKWTHRQRNFQTNGGTEQQLMQPVPPRYVAQQNSLVSHCYTQTKTKRLAMYKWPEWLLGKTVLAILKLLLWMIASVLSTMKGLY